MNLLILQQWKSKLYQLIKEPSRWQRSFFVVLLCWETWIPRDNPPVWSSDQRLSRAHTGNQTLAAPVTSQKVNLNSLRKGNSNFYLFTKKINWDGLAFPEVKCKTCSARPRKVVFNTKVKPLDFDVVCCIPQCSINLWNFNFYLINGTKVIAEIWTDNAVTIVSLQLLNKNVPRSTSVTCLSTPTH